MTPDYLPAGTLKCPNDKALLHWECFQGMRVVKKQDGLKLFQARCPDCKTYFGVKSTEK